MSRYLGALSSQLDGIVRRVQRPWLMRKAADSDAGRTREGLLNVIALADLVRIVHSHDLHAYDGIPVYPSS